MTDRETLSRERIRLLEYQLLARTPPQLVYSAMYQNIPGTPVLHRVSVTYGLPLIFLACRFICLLETPPGDMTIRIYCSRAGNILPDKVF
jgi:hypothetical protein